MCPKIMIVDDEPGIVAVIQSYFEMVGYQVKQQIKLKDFQSVQMITL